VRVLDFGLAKFVGESSETERVMGTLAYVAPEQLRGKDIGPWTGDQHTLVAAQAALRARVLEKLGPVERLLRRDRGQRQ